MELTTNETMTLLELLEAVAAGTATPSHKATAAGLAARFRRRATNVAGNGQTADAGGGPTLDVAAIYARRQQAIDEANAARGKPVRVGTGGW